MNPSHMHRAIALSREAIRQGLGGPFGAVIVRNDRIVAEGFNRVTSSSDPTAHAEIVAIRAACQVLGHHQLADCAIYTSCEPCPMCLGAIYWAHLQRIYFANSRADAAAAGFDDDFLYREISRPLTERHIPVQRLLAAEARTVMDTWTSMKNKLPY